MQFSTGLPRTLSKWFYVWSCRVHYCYTWLNEKICFIHRSLYERRTGMDHGTFLPHYSPNLHRDHFICPMPSKASCIKSEGCRVFSGSGRSIKWNKPRHLDRVTRALVSCLRWTTTHLIVLRIRWRGPLCFATLPQKAFSSFPSLVSVYL